MKRNILIIALCFIFSLSLSSCKKRTVKSEPVYSVEFSLSIESNVIKVGESFILSSNENVDDLITYYSSDENIAIVSDKGLVYGINDGEAIIYAKIGNTIKECRVTVESAQVVDNASYSVRLDKTDLEAVLNKEFYVRAFVFEKDSILSYLDVTFEYDTEAFSEVSKEDNKLTLIPLKIGNYRIKAIYDKSTAYLDVKVSDNIEIILDLVVDGEKTDSVYSIKVPSGSISTLNFNVYKNGTLIENPTLDVKIEDETILSLNDSNLILNTLGKTSLIVTYENYSAKYDLEVFDNIIKTDYSNTLIRLNNEVIVPINEILLNGNNISLDESNINSILNTKTGENLEYRIEDNNIILNTLLMTPGDNEYYIVLPSKKYSINITLISNLINTIEDYNKFMSEVNSDIGTYAYVVFNNDLNFYNVKITENNYNHPFRGVIDGQGHILSNMVLNEALFGVLSGTIKNLALNNITVNTKYAAAFANDFSGVLNNVIATGKVIGSEMQAGLVVSLRSGEIKSSVSVIETLGNVEYQGAISRLNSGVIKDTYAISSINYNDPTSMSTDGLYHSLNEFLSNVNSFDSNKGFNEYFTIENNSIYFNGKNMLKKQNFYLDEYFESFSKMSTLPFDFDLNSINEFDKSSSIIEIRFNEILADNYNYNNGLITLSSDFIKSLDEGEYQVFITSSDFNEFIFKVKVIDLEQVDLSSYYYNDFDKSVDDSYSLNLSTIDNLDLSKEIDKVKVNALVIDSTNYSYNNGLLTFENSYINSLTEGDYIISFSLVNDSKIYDLKVSIVTEIISSIDRLNTIIKGFDSKDTDYYILSCDLVSNSPITSQGRVWNNNQADWNSNFKGVIDGRGHTVSDITITESNYYSACYSYKYSGTLKNIAFKNMTAITKGAVGGGLFLSFSGLMDNVYLDINIGNTSSSQRSSGIADVCSGRIINSLIRINTADENTASLYAIGYSVNNIKLENTYIIYKDMSLYAAGNKDDFNNLIKFESISEFIESNTLPSDSFEINENKLYFNEKEIYSPVSYINLSSKFSLNPGYGLIANTSNASFGNPFVEPAYGCSNIVDISKYQGKTLRITLPSSTTSGLIFLDENEAPSKIDGWSATTDGTYFGEVDIVIPEGAFYVRCCYYVTSHDKYIEIPFSAFIIN